jgi:SAM-dependent methyltransferase
MPQIPGEPDYAGELIMTTEEMPNPVVNLEQAQAWDGEEGARWTEHEERYNASVHRHTPQLLAAAHISATDQVLDIGCGCGESTRRAARAATSGVALGVDLSARMIERARERSHTEGITNILFKQADAQVYPFEGEAFDVIISRFGAMFFGSPVAAFQNIGRALRPRGRLALLSWQEPKRNEWVMALRSALSVGRAIPEPPADAPDAFGLADPGRVRAILLEAGFIDIDLKEINEPMYFGSDSGDAFAFLRTLGFTQGMLKDLDDTSKARALEELQATLTAHQTPEGVLLDSRAWLITAQRP